MGNVKFSIDKRDIDDRVETMTITGRADLGRKLVKNIRSTMEENGIIRRGSECKIGISSISQDEEIPNMMSKRYTLTTPKGERKLDGNFFVKIEPSERGSCKIKSVSLQVDASDFKRMEDCC